MKSIKRLLTSAEQQELHLLIEREPTLPNILDGLHRLGGKAFLVGGVVRDLILGRTLKDIDIEVHGLSIDALRQVLIQFGIVNLVGRSFGVLKFQGKGDLELDWSLPRSDAPGRKPKVDLNPDMDIVQALRRRDLTMNAMAINLSTHELIDPFGGESDIEEGYLRCPDKNLFVEDPLRFYRVMQFVARFEMKTAGELHELCKAMDVNTVSIERVDEEFRKMLLKSNRPSLGLRWLYDIGRLSELFPELSALVSVPQSAEHHPEGNVFEHTCQVVDAAATLKDLKESDRVVILFAALCHDMGKKEATHYTSQGRITSRGHEEVGVPVARAFLKRITYGQKIIRIVTKLVRYHMHPLTFVTSKAKPKAYKKLAKKLAPETDLRMLSYLFEADRRGRNGASSDPLPGPIPDADFFRKQSKQAGVYAGPEQPVLSGDDIRHLVEPGPEMGRLLDKAYEIQIIQGVQDKERIIAQLV